MAKLKLLARGDALFGDREAQESGIRKFIGRKHDPKVGVAGGWVPLEEPVVKDTSLIPPEHAHDYRRGVRQGDLWACDAETARECGVKFDDEYQAALHKEWPHLAPAESPAHDDDHHEPLPAA